jgi:hypothetical protein
VADIVIILFDSRKDHQNKLAALDCAFQDKDYRLNAQKSVISSPTQQQQYEFLQKTIVLHHGQCHQKD